MNSTGLNELQPVNNIVIEDVQKNKALIISKAVERSLLLGEDVAGHGAEAPALLNAGFDFTLKMLESIMLAGSVDLMEDQLSWAETRLPYDGVFPEHLFRRFKILSEVMEELLSRNHWPQIRPYLDWMIKKQEDVVKKGSQAEDSLIHG